MKKYFYIFKSEVLNNLQYAFNLFSNIFSYFLFIYVFMQVWQYVYSDQSSYINGYSLNQMIWYLIITELLYSILGQRALVRKISADVKSGNIAYNINKPYDYVTYSLFSHLGSIFIKSLVFLIVSYFIGLIIVGELLDINFIQLILGLITIALALVVSSLIVIILALFSFFIEDAEPIFWLYSKFTLIVGTLFPIEFFPKIIQPLLSYLPVFATTYGPAKLLVNFKYSFFLKVILVQLIYIIIAYVIAEILYKKGVKKVNVNGG